MAVYSHSKLSTFEQCKYKYKLKYILKIPSPVEKSIEAHLGTCTHYALEWLYNEVLKNNLPTLDDVLKNYILKWEKDWRDNIVIVKKELKSEDYKNKGIKFIVDYYMSHKPFKDGTVDTEKQVWINLSEKDSIIGYIDRLVFNKEKNEYEIHDYKTAKSLPSQKKLDLDRQLALYGIAIKNLYGQDKNILLTWHYLAHNKQIFSKRTNQEFQILKDDTIKLIQTIKNTKVFPPTKMILCDWCEYKGYCKAFGNKLPEKYRENQAQLKLEF